MEEIIKTNGEQPDTNAHSVATQENIGAVENSGSSFGKFNSANDLLNAYNSLQSEFTRKCQRLSELESKVDGDKALAPQYTLDNWQQQIGEFLESHPNAKNYAREIADLLYSDKTLASNPSSLEVAFGRILDKKFKSASELSNDEDFLEEYIYSNQKIKDKILAEYLNSYSKSPKLISSSVGATSSLTPKLKASNLSEAKQLVEQLFK